MTVLGTMFRIRHGFGADPDHDLPCYLSADPATDTPEALLSHLKTKFSKSFFKIYIFSTAQYLKKRMYIIVYILLLLNPNWNPNSQCGSGSRKKSFPQNWNLRLVS